MPKSKDKTKILRVYLDLGVSWMGISGGDSRSLVALAALIALAALVALAAHALADFPSGWQMPRTM